MIFKQRSEFSHWGKIPETRYLPGPEPAQERKQAAVSSRLKILLAFELKQKKGASSPFFQTPFAMNQDRAFNAAS
jgi:hypothetical protein